MPQFAIVTVPPGERIRVVAGGRLEVPDRPIIPFIEGDGTGPDIWRASQRGLRRRGRRRPTAASGRSPGWRSSPARRRSTASRTGCPTRRSRRSSEFLVGIKGPLTTPIGGGIRSLNVALRQMLDLYVCLRPVRYFTGRAEPGEASRAGRHGDLPREHRGHLRRHRVGGGERRGEEGHRVPRRTRWASRRSASRRRAASASSRSRARAPSGSSRAAIEYALRQKRRSVTLVHKGNIMKFTEGAFRDWGYALAAREFRDRVVTERESWILGNKEAKPDDHGRGERPRDRPRLRHDDARPAGEGARRRSRRRSRSGRRTATASGRRSSSSATRSPTSRCSRC